MSKPKLFVITIERTMAILAHSEEEADQIAMELMTSEPNVSECLFTDSTQFTSLEDLEHNLGNEFTDALPYGDVKKLCGAEKTIKQLFDEGAIATK